MKDSLDFSLVGGLYQKALSIKIENGKNQFSYKRVLRTHTEDT